MIQVAGGMIQVAGGMIPVAGGEIWAEDTGGGQVRAPADHLLPLRAPARLAEIITEQAGTAALQVFQLVDHAPHLGARD